MPDVPRGRLHNSSSAGDIGRSFVGAEGFETSRREPKKIEMRFAHLSASSSSAGFDCILAFANQHPDVWQRATLNPLKWIEPGQQHNWLARTGAFKKRGGRPCARHRYVP
jgi:hypothetical protein